MAEASYALCHACQQRTLPRLMEGSKATAVKCQNPDCGKVMEYDYYPIRPDLDKPKSAV